MHFTASMVLNSMLLSLILADGEARNFFKHKFLAWKEENMFHLRKNNLFKTKNKIGPIEVGHVTESISEEIVHSAINVDLHEDLAGENAISTLCVIEITELLVINVEQNVSDELFIVDIE